MSDRKLSHSVIIFSIFELKTATIVLAPLPLFPAPVPKNPAAIQPIEINKLYKYKL